MNQKDIQNVLDRINLLKQRVDEDEDKKIIYDKIANLIIDASPENLKKPHIYVSTHDIDNITFSWVGHTLKINLNDLSTYYHSMFNREEEFNLKDTDSLKRVLKEIMNNCNSHSKFNKFKCKSKLFFRSKPNRTILIILFLWLAAQISIQLFVKPSEHKLSCSFKVYPSKIEK